MRPYLVAANWKMNGNRAQNEALIQALNQGLPSGDKAEVVIAAPFVYLPQLKTLLSDSACKLSAQNVSEFESGAYTGEVSASMLSDLSCEYAIVGHSERRQIFRESDAQIVKKFAQLQANNIRPILCVGETLEERESSITNEVVCGQLNAVIKSLGIEVFSKAELAYEPVWAIGTGKTASPEQAQEVHAILRAELAKHNEEIANSVRIVYGGSVNESNAETLFKQKDINGGLIGGASLKADSFLQIIQVVDCG